MILLRLCREVIEITRWKQTVLANPLTVLFSLAVFWIRCLSCLYEGKDLWPTDSLCLFPQTPYTLPHIYTHPTLPFSSLLHPFHRGSSIWPLLQLVPLPIISTGIGQGKSHLGTGWDLWATASFLLGPWINEEEKVIEKHLGTCRYDQWQQQFGDSAWGVWIRLKFPSK